MIGRRGARDGTGAARGGKRDAADSRLSADRAGGDQRGVSVATAGRRHHEGGEPHPSLDELIPRNHWLLGQLMPPVFEVRAIRRWAGPDSLEANLRIYTLLNNQYNVIYQRAQTLMTFAGLVVTVTGFSGRTIAQTSHLAQTSLVSGMALVLLGAAIAIIWVLRVNWLSGHMGRAGEGFLLECLRERNRKILALRITSLLMVIGFLLYGFAIGLMLLDPTKVLAVPAIA